MNVQRKSLKIEQLISLKKQFFLIENQLKLVPVIKCLWPVNCNSTIVYQTLFTQLMILNVCLSVSRLKPPRTIILSTYIQLMLRI